MAQPTTWVRRPFYWAVEEAAEGKPLSVAWLAMTEEPFFYGKALRFRLGDRAWHFGLCRKSRKPLVHQLDLTTEEIKTWVYD